MGIVQHVWHWLYNGDPIYVVGFVFRNIAEHGMPTGIGFIGL